MKKILIIALYLYATNGMTSVIEINEVNYTYKKLGSLYYVQKLKPSATLELTNMADKPMLDAVCTAINTKVARYKKNLAMCAQGQISSRCESLQLIFKDLNSNWSFNYGSSDYRWSLTSKKNSTDPNLLTNLSKKLKISKNNIRLIDTNEMLQDVNIDKVTVISVPKELHWINDLLDNHELYKIGEFNKTIESKGRIASCFIYKELIQTEFSLTNSFIHNEKKPISFIKKAYKVYKQLLKADTKDGASKYIQAAYIGYHLGKLIETHEVNTPLADLFQKFTRSKSQEIKIQTFSNLEHFSNKAYPREFFEYEVNLKMTTGITK